MRPLTRPGLALGIAVAVIALPTAASGALSSPAAATANSATYQDSTGENPAAPDITTITVSNTDAGLVTFRINVPNRATLGQDMAFFIYVDTDNKPTTGDPDTAGTDYVMQLLAGEIALFRWDGTGFSRRFGDPSAVTLNFSYQAGLTARISASELGNTRNFKFYIEAYSGLVIDPVTGDIDGSKAVLDAAPGGGVGLYPYQVQTAPARLVVKSLKPSPATPVAGKSFTLRLVAARSDTGAVVRNGRVTCVGRLGSARLKARVQAVQGGAATCTWNIGAAAKGKTFRGSVAIVFEGLRATQSFTGKVR